MSRHPLIKKLDNNNMRCSLLREFIFKGCYGEAQKQIERERMKLLRQDQVLREMKDLLVVEENLCED